MGHFGDVRPSQSLGVVLKTIVRKACFRHLMWVRGYFVALATRQCLRRRYVFRLSRTSVQPDIVTVMSRERLDNFYETDSKHSIAPTDDLSGFVGSGSRRQGPSNSKPRR